MHKHATHIDYNTHFKPSLRSEIPYPSRLSFFHSPIYTSVTLASNCSSSTVKLAFESVCIDLEVGMEIPWTAIGLN